MAEEYRRYPGFRQREVKSDVDAHIENIDILGYSIVKSVIDKNEAARISSLLDEAYVKQKREFGVDYLKKLNEHPTHRGLLADDTVFRDMVINSKVSSVISAILGDTAWPCDGRSYGRGRRRPVDQSCTERGQAQDCHPVRRRLPAPAQCLG